MAKLALKANPTFLLKVGIPVAGGAASNVVFTAKHRTKTALQELIATRTGKEDIETVLDICSSWDLDDEFNEDNVKELLENYSGAALAIWHGYVDELMAAKAKN